ncbi:MAG: dipeptidyl carboxypeptidase II, partial [Xanthomonadales bacterium]|nr:dipeptidyl carboxypeptidase II [Xanthomonadales bacterium]
MNSKLPLALGVALAFSIAGCSKSDNNQVADATSQEPASDPMTTQTADSNPFFNESPLYMHYPQFDKVENAYYKPAFERGMEEQLAEIQAIVDQSEAPTFDNTLVPLEKSGQTLNRVSRVFYSMTSAHTNDKLEEIRTEMAPKLSAHNDQILLNAELFARIQDIYDQRDSLELDPESYHLVEETYKNFVRAGAKLSDAEKEQLKSINAELASLQTTFSQNVLNEVNNSGVVVDTREELAGMSDAMIDAAAEAAREKGLEGKYLITLLNTT